MENLYIVISDAYWNTNIWASRHYMPKSLAENGNTVIFIEKAPTIISPIFYDISWNKVSRKPKIEKISENFYVYYPLVRFPFDRKYKIVSSINQRIMFKEIKNLIKKFNFENIFIISFDHKAGLIFEYSKYKNIYYVVDEVSEFNWPFSDKQTVIQDENKTIKNSDLVIATSKPLLERALKLNDRCEIISHGVDIQSYLKDLDIEDKSLDKINNPIIGFMGKIESWVDIDLIYNLAKELNYLSFVIIGPSSVPIDKLLKLENVIFLGEKKKTEFPYYLKKFSIGLIPFKINELVRNVNPLKLYEYLAAGVAVISTPMDAVKGFEDYDVYIEETFEGFKSRILYLINNFSEEAKERRINFAKNNSWNEKAKRLQLYCEEIN